MKRIKIGFLALVAIFAMSFTIADHQGILAKIKIGDITCLTTDATHYEQIEVNNVTKTVGEDCFVTTGGDQICAEPLTVNTTQRDCDGTNTFCCAVLIAADPLSCSSPEETFEIYCEP
jgi:hypothetical protein